MSVKESQKILNKVNLSKIFLYKSSAEKQEKVCMVVGDVT